MAPSSMKSRSSSVRVVRASLAFDAAGVFVFDAAVAAAAAAGDADLAPALRRRLERAAPSAPFASAVDSFVCFFFNSFLTFLISHLDLPRFLFS